MGSFFRILAKPVTRFLVGVIAIPLFRLFMRKVIRLQQLDAELEKDMEQWFRGSLVLLVATRNMEEFFFHWLPDLFSKSAEFNFQEEPFWVAFLMGTRLLLAMSVIEMMPDQELFSIIHPGPPKIKYDKSKSIWQHFRIYTWPMLRGLVCQHLNRSSPVFAILCAIVPDTAGWVCFGFAITQYLIIGLVTSKDKALDALSEFDRQVALRRRELLDEFDYIEEEVQRKNAQAAEANTAEGE
ncbi:MAG: DNA topoisomerase I [Planctomycetaceae bacterium]|jgi:hypothetical protein|nr:DNA topoisomerase I [Planctomycetaceae bacterium]MDC0273700.1 DNA topoisomerase I [Planctomycetaceae bacterium]MDG2388958.1 DNA topoisomerase I [Planctomycetaceae bacterium]